jgi:hypothetical protein
MNEELQQLPEEMKQLNHLNNQCVELMNNENIEKALKQLKKAEHLLEVTIVKFNP